MLAGNYQRFADATYETQIRSLTRTYEPRVRSAFLAAMQDIKDRTQMRALRDAIRAQDIEAAIQAINIDAASMVRLQSTVLEVYGNSGQRTITSGVWTYPNGQRAVVRWNGLSPRAEEYARTLSSKLVQGITAETIDVVRDTIADGYVFSRSADRVARDLVGHIGPNGRRSGGVVGMDGQSAQWVRNLRTYLETDPMRATGMKINARDAALIRRANAQGRRLTASQIEGIARRYENNILLVRGRRIARTETRNATEAGKYEAWQQGLEKTGVPEQFVIREWIHTGRALRDRPDHLMMHKSTERGLNVPFVLPDGTAMLHPHDNSYGAGPEHIINCECEARYTVDKKGLALWRASLVR